MAEGMPRPLKTVEEIELRDGVQQRQWEWTASRAENREAERQRFNEALRAFNAIFLRGQYPDDE
jgi:hypothetical protein